MILTINSIIYHIKSFYNTMNKLHELEYKRSIILTLNYITYNTKSITFLNKLHKLQKTCMILIVNYINYKRKSFTQY